VWAHYRLKEISTKDSYRGMDWVGFIAFAVGLGLVLLAMTYLSFGLTGYLPGFAMLETGLALLLFFIWYEFHGKMTTHPLLDMNLFKIKEFAGGTVAMLFNAIAWSGILIMVSFYLQVIVGYTPLQTGFSLLALESTFIFVAPVAGRLSDKYGSRTFCIAGLTISSGSFFLFALLNATTDISIVLLALALLGLGTGLWVSPNISSIMGSVPANRRGIASGFRITLSNVGDTVSFGLAILLMTLVIPYNVLNNLVNSYSIPGAVLIGKDQFIHGFQLVAIVLASINTIAILPASFAKKRGMTPAAVVEDEKRRVDARD
jgi:MFS family permease